ncbi:hypothetical protein TPAR_01192 [Tolypocladium paradoxum]|uniref:Uncharacterized protein n=1 Tax=Tolypocladium paradoxum TaxID=94208 RepID=A0A2S4L864_9HYPO|nr:hypothetical protein TPAR_01192 [Tolypocladium paradoxum]
MAMATTVVDTLKQRDRRRDGGRGFRGGGPRGGRGAVGRMDRREHASAADRGGVMPTSGGPAFGDARAGASSAVNSTKRSAARGRGAVVVKMRQDYEATSHRRRHGFEPTLSSRLHGRSRSAGEAHTAASARHAALHPGNRPRLQPDSNRNGWRVHLSVEQGGAYCNGALIRVHGGTSLVSNI